MERSIFLLLSNREIALDPETGKQRWAYDPKIDLTLEYGEGLVNRGVSTRLDPKRTSGQPCRRIYEATQDARLVALDAATGKPCLDFGDYGQVNLRDVPGYRAAMPAGLVLAFDGRSGALRWSWDPMPVAPA